MPAAILPAEPKPQTTQAEDRLSPANRQAQSAKKHPVSTLAINLPTALRLANASNPTIALAGERVAEAYARLQQAKALWLPTLQTGPGYNRHDGRIQNCTGIVFDTSKSNFFEGGGPVMGWQGSEALFGPRMTGFCRSLSLLPIVVVKGNF